MKLLVIDTCGAEGSLALADTVGDPGLVELTVLGGRTSSERLIPEISSALAHMGWGLGELGAIGVVAGPGSFTGVRVGMAAAKGLCEAGAVPLVVVSRLQILANKVGSTGETTHAVLDAGRGQFFYGRYAAGEAPAEALLSREAVLDAVAGGGRVVVCEEGVRAALGELQPVFAGTLDAGDALRTVVSRAAAGDFDDVAVSDANYVRRTDLEMLAKMAKGATGA